ncbi:MAG: GLUG motif-containing protein [Eubacteriales bacterium]
MPVTNHSGTIGTDVYFDKSVLGLTTVSQGTAKSTAQLSTAALPTGFLTADWTPVLGSYPRLKMADTYANSFCALATVPLQLDTRELLDGGTLANGVHFQTKISNTVNGSAITLTSSKLDITDTIAYPSGYDPSLSGNGTDKNVDMLFGPTPGDTASTTVYRNIFKTDTFPLAANLQLNTVQHSELWYNCKTPVVTLTSTVNGFVVSRRMKIPLEIESANHFYLATERQLRALSNGLETYGTKFNYLESAIGLANVSRVDLTADINLRGIEFEPIALFKGIFEGNNFTVSKLKITKPGYDNIGFFKTFESTSTVVEVNNLNISDVWVTGKNYVGALIGVANQLSQISNCKVYPSGILGVAASYVTGAEKVGGLVGWAEGTIKSECRSAVDVTGENTVGGLVGLSAATISNCLATGNVTVALIKNTGSNLGIGGFAGFVTAGAIAYAFATGNVFAGQAADFTNNPKKIGVGGFIGVISGNYTSVTACFASGDVRAEKIGILKMTTTGLGSLMFGVGGFVGLNESQVTGCYSSSLVYAQYTGEISGTSGSLVGAGVGGVSGIALNTVSDAYSSGSVSRDITGNPVENAYTYFTYNDVLSVGHEALGGVIGTKMAATSNFTLLYFDSWNNSYGADLTAIGGLADAGSIRGLTTDQLCKSPKDSLLELNGNYWNFNNGAYPCFTDLVSTLVSPYIRYPAVLSVASVTLDIRDTSARTGNGITMAITTASNLTINGILYNINWKTSDSSEVYFLTSGSGSTKTFAPIRTGNASQNLGLIAEVTGYEVYGQRRYNRPCADMFGTMDKPYLISNKSDLQHIGPLIKPTATGFEDFYNTWYSPLNPETHLNVAGKVYFKLLSDINMIVDVNIVYNSGTGKLTATVVDAGDGILTNDNHYIPSLAGVSYDGIVFAGISMAGNDYSIDNFTSNREFLYGISAVSEVKDVSFENININSVGTANEDLGTAIVRHNQGTIDGCMILSGNITGGNNVAGIVANNYATLTNSLVKANITGKSSVGGISATNTSTGNISNCAYAGGTITVTQAADTVANAGGIAGSNSGHITDCYSMGSITSTNGATVIGGLAGENTATGVIGAAYSRTNVSGKNNIGGFIGTNAGAITNAFSAGKVTVAIDATQTGIFCGTNTGTIVDAFADKALSGKSTYKIIADAAFTEKIMKMTCFSTGGTASTVFTKQTAETAYPQLTHILALDDAYGTGVYVPQKYKLLIGYSAVSAATFNTRYSQYVNTLSTGTLNPLSVITGVTWASSVPAIAAISSTNLSTITSGATIVTASMAITASNGKTFTATMPISVTVGDQNPNFLAGSGSSGNPYQIDSVENFNSLAYYGPDSEINYIVTSDINYNQLCPPTAITEFAGHLDGQKFVVYDLTVNNNSGLFKFLNTGAAISNLGLIGAKTTTASSEGYVGLLAGHAQDASITNCFAIGEISISAGYVGGLVGYANAGTTITGCLTSGKIVNSSMDSASNVGGIAGYADTLTSTGISSCFSTAYVKGAAGNIGGIVGKMINGSKAASSTYAGMVMDTALANGATVPTVSNIGNIAGNKLDTSAITGCSYDKQITLVADTNATAKFTAELLAGSSYTVASGLSGGLPKFAAGVLFATMPVRFLLGSAAGATRSFSKISLPATISSDGIVVTEIPQHTASYLTIGSGSPIIITLASNVDLADVYAGLKINLSTVVGTKFAGINNEIFRYVEPRLNRIISVSYTLTNGTGVPALNTQTLAVQVKNKHTFAGEPVTYSSDVFTTIASNPALFDEILVSSGGIFAGSKLPAGYGYQVTAKDQSDTSLTVSSIDGEYGKFIALNDGTTAIVINYTIVNNAPWGVYKLWDSLVDSLVHS